MRARVWGCRGSLAAPGPETVRYGGNTSCVEVRVDDEVIVLDAGTGIRPLGLALQAEGVTRVHLLLSHLHMDHLQGLGFFAPIFNPAAEVHVWGPVSPMQSLDERIATYLSPPLFPVRLADIPSRVIFHDCPEGAFAIGSATVRAAKVSHQGPTVGFRIDHRGRSLTYIPDHEPSLGIDLRLVEPAWISGHHLASKTDVLIHDAQYTEDEYPHKIGWGHSSIDHVVTFGRAAGVERLVLFHHDPLHCDEDLDALLERATSLWGDHPGGPELAFEGMVIDLPPVSLAAESETGGAVVQTIAR
jgi:phosphoribosyl 1,2-cyclic phosphodiesterase